ncbi:sodium-dependent glucose transporter 1B-like [Mizuhopecten yessoensis]|uniref:sodium-dependent glucose transporter 1B-like n=1 Tax=Mizuhopecten yessoensis TaxID=6573 RepID=UPI000B459D2A|nr:sodium-dependent glucose transporter 1B-like [Mizuhopecten yessoensis]
MDLLDFVLKTTYFSFRNIIYKQCFGTALGSPVSPNVANLFMEHLEQEAIATAPIECKPNLWKRYVDDILELIKNGAQKDLTLHINTIDAANNITLLCEEETNGTMPFLDTLLVKKGDGTVKGWIVAQTDTALLELQRITSVSLEESSLFMTVWGFGYLAGSFLCGAVYDRLNKFLSQFVSLILIAICLTVIPWCYNHIVMNTAHAVLGCLLGFLDTVVIAEMLAIWGNGARSFMQALHFGYAVGGIISPAIIAQFTTAQQLVPTMPLAYDATPKYGSDNLSMTSGSNMTLKSHVESSHVEYQALIVTQHRISTPVPFYVSSPIFIPYVISACVCALIGLSYLVIALVIHHDLYTERAGSNMTSSKHMSTCWRIAVLINMGMMAGIYVGIEDAISAFLTVYCVTYLEWSVSDGTYILSLFNGCFALGLLLAILWVSYINPKDVLGFICVLVSAMLFGMVWSGLTYSDIGIWISVALTGFCMAVIFPAIFTWMEEDFFPVTGKIASYFNAMGAAGATVSPIVIGTLMDRYTKMWFAYTLLAGSCVLVVTYTAGLILSRCSRLNRRKYVYHKLQPIMVVKDCE